METSPVTAPAASAAGTPVASAAGTPAAPQRMVSSDFNTFLRMLTVQMQNQDPLDPTDSADYAVQLATFSGVEQQVKTNELLGALSTQMTLSGLAQMAGWVGQEARAAMPARFEGTPVTISPNPVAGADRVELVVKDAQGREIERKQIPASNDPIEWAGVGADGTPRPAGLYSFEVVSYKGGEAVRTDPAEVYATVAEVRAEGGKAVLVMEGGVTVAADKVTALRMAG